MHLSAKLSDKPFSDRYFRKTAFCSTLRMSKVNCTPYAGLVPAVQQATEDLSSYHPLSIFTNMLCPAAGFPVDLTVERSPIGSTQKGFQLHLCKSMFRAYSIRCFSSNEQPDINSVVSLKVVDILSSLMYVSRYSSFWLQMIIFV